MKATDKMKLGDYKGVQLSDVPPDYLIKIYNFRKLPKALRKYISENYATLQKRCEVNSEAQMKAQLVRMDLCKFI